MFKYCKMFTLFFIKITRWCFTKQIEKYYGYPLLGMEFDNTTMLNYVWKVNIGMVCFVEGVWCFSCSQWVSIMFPKGVSNSTSLYPISFAQSFPLLPYIGEQAKGEATPSSHRNCYFGGASQVSVFSWQTHCKNNKSRTWEPTPFAE